LTPSDEPPVRDWPAFRRYAIGGALVAGYVDFALIAFRFQRDHIVGVAAISIWFAVAGAVGPIAGILLDRSVAALVIFSVVFQLGAIPFFVLGDRAYGRA
jgi:hypothetical protein